MVFVHATAPGETVRARVLTRKARFWTAEVIEILQPSPWRRTPPCPVANQCGGCCWQHVEYSEQVIQKRKILSASLRGLRKQGGEWEDLPFQPAPNEFHYRNRIQLQNRNGQFGFFTKRSHDLVTVDECWIADPQINSQLSNLKPQTAPKIEIAVNSQDGGFSQVNAAQNTVLKSLVLARIKGNPEWVLDLYAGSGNFTGPLAEKLKSAIAAIELSAAAVQRGRRQIQNVTWHAGDVAEVLQQLEPSKGAGLVLLDPPRLGCTVKVLEQLVRHAPKQIIYVSCNPTTFARDAEHLVRSGRYLVESVQGLDMFPQTEHVELVASLCAAT